MNRFLDNIKVTIRSDSSFFFVVKKSEMRFNILNICSKDFAMVFVIFMNIKIITFYVLKRIYPLVFYFMFRIL